MFARRSDRHLPPLTEAQCEIAKKLSDHVTMLAATIGARSLTMAPENLEKAAQYVEYCLSEHSYAMTRQEFSVEGLDVATNKKAGDVQFETKDFLTRNIIAEMKGGNAANEIIVLGAHYDSVYDCPAANDNGSGVAALLELARLLATHKTDRTIRFVAFTNEEQPFFGTKDWGAKRYAKECKKRKEEVVAMISLETMGYFSNEPGSQLFPHSAFTLFYPNAGNFIAFVSNLRSRGLLDKFTASFKKSTAFPSESVAVPEQIRGIGFSDHAAFWQEGYRAIMVTDTAFYRYPQYHTQEDTPDKVDYESLARIVSGICGAVKKMSAKHW